MTYSPPDAEFSASLVARNVVINANQFRDLISQQYIASYHQFWGIGTRTVEEQQSVIDVLGQVGLQILTDSAAFVEFVDEAYPGSLPKRYQSSPYTYELTADGRLILLDLKEAWNEEASEADPSE